MTTPDQASPPGNGNGSVPIQPELAARESLIDYPSPFPIKVMGENLPGFREAVIAVALQFDPAFDSATIEERPSRGDKYLGLTVTITATSRAQLDDLYRSLSAHPMVKVVL